MMIRTRGKVGRPPGEEALILLFLTKESRLRKEKRLKKGGGRWENHGRVAIVVVVAS